MRVRYCLFLALGLAVWGCMDADDSGVYLSPINYDFNQGLQEWQSGFADYPAKEDSVLYELKFSYEEAPSYLGIGKAIMLSGYNHGDLFMFIKKKITGLKPDAFYTLTFNIELASNATFKTPTTDPGESVFLKAGAASIEPLSVVQNGRYVMNIDKGDQSRSGRDMITIADLGTHEAATDYVLTTHTNSIYNSPFEAKTNSNGELWLIIGTDSGHKGSTTIYFSKINVVMSSRD